METNATGPGLIYRDDLVPLVLIVPVLYIAYRAGRA